VDDIDKSPDEDEWMDVILGLMNGEKSGSQKDRNACAG